MNFKTATYFSFLSKTKAKHCKWIPSENYKMLELINYLKIQMRLMKIIAFQAIFY